jgi:hypothetical protein
MKPSFAKIICLLALTSIVVPAASAAETPAATNPYEIKSIQKTVKRVLHVDNGWKNNAPCIQAELRVNRDLGESKPYARAYFFDRGNNLVDSYKGPVQASDDHKTYTSMPVVFKPRDGHKVCFPISEKSTQSGEKWARVVVVFGAEDYAVAECHPKDDLAKFYFPEKELVMKSARTPPGPGSAR